MSRVLYLSILRLLRLSFVAWWRAMVLPVTSPSVSTDPWVIALITTRLSSGAVSRLRTLSLDLELRRSMLLVSSRFFGRLALVLLRESVSGLLVTLRSTLSSRFVLRLGVLVTLILASWSTSILSSRECLAALVLAPLGSIVTGLRSMRRVMGSVSLVGASSRRLVSMIASSSNVILLFGILSVFLGLLTLTVVVLTLLLLAFYLGRSVLSLL